MEIKITKDNFEEEVIKSELPVVVDFWADWCGPCKMMSPVVDAVAQEMPDIKVCKVNVDEEPDLARRFNIMSIPTLVVIKDGKIADMSVGLTDKSALMQMIKNA